MRLLQYFHILLLLVALLALSGCEPAYDENPRLRRVAVVLAAPDLTKESALAMLDTLADISPDSLSEAGRHYRDFLTIKASDKGYLGLKSDSLYLTVKEYFSSHNSEILPEVLYYGGRVYSDMGVYPVALQYFQDALARTGDNPSEINLRRRALSQTGGVLSTLGLHDEALPYVEETVLLSKVQYDTVAWIYDLLLAGDISDRMKDYPKATRYFSEAVRLSEGRQPRENTFGRFRLGEVAWDTGDTVAALSAFDATIDVITPEYRNYALPVVAQVWREAGNPDKAYLYARELVGNPDPLNKKIGYRLLISPGLREHFHPDTLNVYVLALDSILIDTKKETMAETARLQHTVYNYNLHDRERRKAEKERDRLKIWLLVASVLVMLLILVIIWRAFLREKYRNRSVRTMAKRKIIETTLAKSLENLKETAFESDADKPQPPVEQANDETDLEKADEEPPVSIEESILRSEDSAPEKKEADERSLLLMKTEKLCGSVKSHLEWEQRLSVLRKSAPYKRMMELLMLQKKIEKGDRLWVDFGRELDTCYPGFIERLRTLAEDKLTLDEEQTAMLVKGGFEVKEMTVLLGRAKGTIGSRRASIGLKIFHDKRGVGMVDLLLKVL